MRILYTAEATVEGGRSGHGRTADGRLDGDLSVPKELGGDDDPGTNPEELFAIGYAACFQSALLSVAQRRGFDATDSTITARVGLGQGAEREADPEDSRWIKLEGLRRKAANA